MNIKIFFIFGFIISLNGCVSTNEMDKLSKRLSLQIDELKSQNNILKKDIISLKLSKNKIESNIYYLQSELKKSENINMELSDNIFQIKKKIDIWDSFTSEDGNVMIQAPADKKFQFEEYSNEF